MEKDHIITYTCKHVKDLVVHHVRVRRIMETTKWFCSKISKQFSANWRTQRKRTQHALKMSSQCSRWTPKKEVNCVSTITSAAHSTASDLDFTTISQSSSSLLLYVHGDRTDYLAQGAQDGHSRLAHSPCWSLLKSPQPTWSFLMWRHNVRHYLRVTSLSYSPHGLRKEVCRTPVDGLCNFARWKTWWTSWAPRT